jgi:hypothetical protein
LSYFVIGTGSTRSFITLRYCFLIVVSLLRIKPMALFSVLTSSRGVMTSRLIQKVSYPLTFVLISRPAVAMVLFSVLAGVAKARGCPAIVPRLAWGPGMV